MIKNKPNAQHGDEQKGLFLHIRVTKEQKAKWVKQAQSQGMKLSDWVLEKLETSVKRASLSNKLELYNKWRRDEEDIPQPNPTEIGIWIDEAVKELRK
jgi:hypothetical protein